MYRACILSAVVTLLFAGCMAERDKVTVTLEIRPHPHDRRADTTRLRSELKSLAQNQQICLSAIRRTRTTPKFIRNMPDSNAAASWLCQNTHITQVPSGLSIQMPASINNESPQQLCDNLGRAIVAEYRQQTRNRMFEKLQQLESEYKKNKCLLESESTTDSDRVAVKEEMASLGKRIAKLKM